MVEVGFAVGLLILVELNPVEGLHDQLIPLPPVSFNCAAASFMHFEEAPVTDASDGCTVIVITFDESNDVFIEQATASL